MEPINKLGHPAFRLVIVAAVLAFMTSLIAGAVWLTSDARAQPAQANAEPPREVADTEQPRVLVFFGDRDTDCLECQLHRVRLGYYAFQFKAAGAEVIGVDAGGPLGESEALPWTVVSDRSGELAAFYGAEGQRRNENPVVVVLGSDGRVFYRAQPEDIDDRIEGEVLTSIAAAQASVESYAIGVLREPAESR